MPLDAPLMRATVPVRFSDMMFLGVGDAVWEGVVFLLTASMSPAQPDPRKQIARTLGTGTRSTHQASRGRLVSRGARARRRGQGQHGVMAGTNSLREFLISRRARIDPDSVGLPTSPVPRRRRGLRREEVAALAGVSVDYYARLEQGRVGNISDQVLTAIEDVLRLDALERKHVRRLLSSSAGGPDTTQPYQPRAWAGMRRLIEAMDPVPALLQGPRMEVLEWNRAAAVLLTDFGSMPVRDRNIARWLFLDESTRTRYPDWDAVAAPTVAALRAAHRPGRPDDDLDTLVRELAAASRDFTRFWADYQLFKHGHGTKRIFHPQVGVMTLNYETLDVPESGGQFLSTYTADVGSPSEERLSALLTREEEGADSTGDQMARSALQHEDQPEGR
ncbi:helix-turn-helix domain-containing protein [Promicromonospora sp. CA-289599]|uniref:MmyB family transcriptional regulator n=1 Tax=Promicromonospora sp. CA-289599 TaxID=3240014 RepID=UPI003D911A44